MIPDLRPATPYVFTVEELVDETRLWSNVTLTTVRPQLELQVLYTGYTGAEIKWRRVGYDSGPGVVLMWWRSDVTGKSSMSGIAGSRPTKDRTFIKNLLPNSEYQLRIKEDLEDYTVEQVIPIKTDTFRFEPVLRNLTATSIGIDFRFQPEVNIFQNYFLIRRVENALVGRLTVLDSRIGLFFLENLKSSIRTRYILN